MHSALLKIGIVAALLSASISVNSATLIPDAPVVAIEPGLSIDPRLGVGIGWVDDQTLLVSAMIDDNSQFWERRVMRVDAKTGETTVEVNSGHLLCTNPREGIAGISVGSNEQSFVGKSDKPKAEKKLYSWSSWFGGKLSQNTETDNWNLNICKKTLPRDVKAPGSLPLFSYKGILYLEEEDGYLQFRGHGEQHSVVLSKDDKPVATLQAKPNEITQEPQYLPFRDEYLLSSGHFTMSGTMVRGDAARVTEYPALTMTRSGAVQREFFRPIFEEANLKVDGFTFPYAKGWLIYAATGPQDGGGIYLHQGKSTKRIWCTNNGNHYDRRCRLSSISISPNGCYAAFHEVGSDNPKTPYSTDPTLKILPLCN